LTATATSFTASLPSSFQLAPDEVHIWCANLDVPPETSACLYATITPDERARSARFRFERDQQRFIVARGVPRSLLGRYHQIEPNQISFVYNEFGKPDLSHEFGDRLNFNFSHSAGLAAERNYLISLPSQLHAEAFFKCWKMRAILTVLWRRGRNYGVDL
jgi:4'-phosphopantetheinyl transferase family protien